MKYDLAKPATRSARRTLEAFRRALLDALAEQPFESVTVNALCERADYPRATFYNYFDDKYDLLGYLWRCLAEEAGVDEATQVPPEDTLRVYFNRLYDIAEANEDAIRAFARLNQPEGYLLSSFRIQLGRVVRAFFDRCTAEQQAEHHPVPAELVTEQTANTVLLVLEWRFLRGNSCTREEALGYLEYLLGSLAR